MSGFICVSSEYGKIRGIKKDSSLGISFNAFLGIPYASAPVGILRFKDPLPPAKWNDTFDATVEKSGCYGENFYLKKIVGSEDCLFLNIFTKSVQPRTLQPVMIYIHGGGFNSGSSTTDLLGPDYLLMADVVVVTINYRLGALGFLSLTDEKLNVPGNAGLKDQLMAITFIKNNIQHFGGDPNNITLFGHSAGGCSVSWHCVSEKSKGLFNKAIIMSGCILSNWSLTPHSDWANRLAKKLGYEGTDDEKEILDFLQKADPVKIVEVQDSLRRPEERGKVSYAFAPQIERFITDATLISELPIDLVRKAWSSNVDMILGTTSDEGLMYLEYINQAPALLKALKVESLIPSKLNLNSVDDPLREKFVELLLQTYYPLGSDPTEDALGFCKMKGDEAILHGMHRMIRSRMNSGGKGKTFFYRFAVDSPTQNHYRNVRLGSEIRGVSHGDEISYLFKTIHVDVPRRDSMEFKAIQRLVSLFTSFATSGNPNDDVIFANNENVQWNPIESNVPPFKCLNIGETLKVEVFPEAHRMAVWDQMYENTNTPLY